MRPEDLLMSSQNVDYTTPDEQLKTQTMPEREFNGAPTDGATHEEGNLDDLLTYQPVPPRRIVTISIHYRRLGRGRPLPYLLDEDAEE
jgi:hypothetical protein